MNTDTRRYRIPKRNGMRRPQAPDLPERPAPDPVGQNQTQEHQKMKRATINILAAAALAAGLGSLLIPNGPELLNAMTAHSEPALTRKMLLGAAITFLSMTALMFTAEPQGKKNPRNPDNRRTGANPPGRTVRSQDVRNAELP